MRPKKVDVKGKLSRQTKNGVISFVFRTVANWLYYNLIHGIFGRFFTSYDREEEYFENSITGFITGHHRGKNSILRRVRKKFAAAFDKSLIVSVLERIPDFMLSLTVRAYGTFTMVFGFYSIAMTMLKYVINDNTVVDTDALVVGTVLVIAAAPMLFIKQSLAWVLRSSSISRLVLIRLLRIHEDKLYPSDGNQNPGYSLALILGMLLGASTYFIPPSTLISLGILLVIVGVVLSLPEAGIMAMIASVPFLSFFKHPTVILSAGVLLTLISYWIKYLRGKRTMRYGLTSLFVAIFSLVMLFGGIISVGGRQSLYTAIVYFIFLQGFNLIVNLFRTKDDCRHALAVLSVSGAVAAIYGVAQYVFGHATADWFDTEMFAYIEGRATSFFDNPNVFGAYLILIFPLMLSIMLYSKGAKKKFLSVFVVIVSVLALVWTWSRGAWVGAIVGTIMFFVIFSYKSLQVLLAGGLCLPLAVSFLPQGVVHRFLSIGSISDSSTHYRVLTWKGVARMLEQTWASGIGVGQTAFEQVYPMFAYVGTQASPHAHNLTMHLLGEVGVFGFVMFAAVIILFAQNCFTSMSKCTGAERMTIVAGLCGIVSALVMGLADNIWYNYRVFFVFWCVMALIVAYINAINVELREVHEDSTSSHQANISINIFE